MNKEKIEKDDNYWKGYIEKQKETIEICKICKYRKRYKELEQKESILDKVTEFIKDDVTAEDIKFEGSKTVHFIYKNLINITKEKIAEGINSYKDEIEDIIIEGEKK